MYINTTSLEALTSSLSNLLNITEDDLLNELNQCWIASTKDRGACNLDVLDREIEKFILRHPPHQIIDEILMFHLSRRLLPALDNSSKPLDALLLEQSDLSDFLQEYEIKAVKYENRLVLMIHDECLDSKSHLLYRLEEDYCVNGFLFKNFPDENDYFKSLSKCPEFISDLAREIDMPELKDSFMGKSRYFCFTYRLALKDVIFDGYSLAESEKECHLIRLCCEQICFLKRQSFQGNNNKINPILRISDDSHIPETALINRDVLLSDYSSNSLKI